MLLVWLMVWCLKPLSTLFQLYRGDRCTYPCFPEFFLPVLRAIFFPRYWLLSLTTVAEIIVSGERGMTSVAMTIINPRKEYWSSSGIEPATSCSQVPYTTDRAMGLGVIVLDQSKILSFGKKLNTVVCDKGLILYQTTHF